MTDDRFVTDHELALLDERARIDNGLMAEWRRSSIGLVARPAPLARQLTFDLHDAALATATTTIDRRIA